MKRLTVGLLLLLAVPACGEDAPTIPTDPAVFLDVSDSPFFKITGPTYTISEETIKGLKEGSLLEVRGSQLIPVAREALAVCPKATPPPSATATEDGD